MAEKSYDRLDGVIWYDGRLVPWGDATLHVCSHGLHYASSVFEGERAYGGQIFKCTEHQINGITLFELLGNLLERTVDNALGKVLLAALHDDIDEMRDERALVARIGNSLAFLSSVTT